MIDFRYIIRRILRRTGLAGYIQSIIFLENRIRHLKYYKFSRAREMGVFYFYLDPNLRHPGLADRLKAIVSCYYIAKTNNYQFKIVFCSPFELKDFLQPNMVKWYAESKELEFSVINTKVIDYKGEFIHLLPHKQYVCYNYCGEIIKDPRISIDNDWCLLFNELFIPSEKLRSLVEGTGYDAHSYVAVHLRFVNALGAFEKGGCTLSPKAQKDLLQKCKKGIESLCLSNNQRVMVFSDSSYFLDNLNDLPVIILSHNNIKHMGYSSNEDNIMKTFLDFLMISRASKVYRIITPELYPTNFSYIAALTGKVPFFDFKL